jgi:hypothetical protein
MLNYGAATFEKQILCPSRDFTFSHSQGQKQTHTRHQRHVCFVSRSKHQKVQREVQPLIRLGRFFVISAPNPCAVLQID